MSVPIPRITWSALKKSSPATGGKMFYLIVLGGYSFLIFLVIVSLYKLHLNQLLIAFIVSLFILAPFWEQLWGKWLMFNYARHNRPLQKIIRTVEKPGSVLWIDNVWPGFDEYARFWMVENYLDGVHLHTLGLNDGKGNIYVYRASPEDFSKSAKMRPAMAAAKKRYEQVWEKTGGRSTKEVIEAREKYSDLEGAFLAQRKKEAIQRVRNPEVYPFKEPNFSSCWEKFAYRIEWRPIALSGAEKKYIWCDEVTVTDVGKNEKFAYNKRCLQYTPALSVVSRGGLPFENGVTLGDIRAFEFSNDVVFEYSLYVKFSFPVNRSQLSRKRYDRDFSSWELNANKEGDE
jgi:hypothetical protein